MAGKKTKKLHNTEVIPEQKKDRRLLPHVPDPAEIRKLTDRRGMFAEDDRVHSEFKRQKGQRYEMETAVSLRTEGKGGSLKGTSVDISQTGILIRMDRKLPQSVGRRSHVRLDFRIPPGAFPEGMEKRARIYGRLVRSDEENGLYAFEFDEPLYAHFRKKKDRFLYSSAVVMLLFVALFVVLMRVESVLYFRFNWPLYLYSIIAAVFLLTRYLFGAMYKPVPIDPDFQPGVTIIIPCFNEETWIRRTILSCVDQDYPVDKLQVIIVDDCSNDNSRQAIQETVTLLHGEADRYRTRERVSTVFLEKNGGKREALAAGNRLAMHELVTFVDSDSFLEPDAIKNLVQPFRDPKVGGVSGRTDVANTYTNWLTKMQAVRYFIAFRVMKAAEAYFDSVMCLSGPLSCYRKSIVDANTDKWLNQQFLGQKATFGDDRALTGMTVRHNRTYYQDTAICSTIVPSRQKVFLRQQMRWKRSWLRESIIAAGFIWRKEPFMALFFYTGLVVPVAAPAIVVYNLIYVPLTQRIFPTTFLLGILMMALLMSFAQLMLRKSSLWLYGLWFCLYYEAILLWQMPWAWMTFWKSTWGTRLTPADLREREKKKSKSVKADKPVAEDTHPPLEPAERILGKAKSKAKHVYKPSAGSRRCASTHTAAHGK